MAFYPDVKKGDRFAPRADLENDVRHFFNTLNGFRGGAISGNSSGVKVKVYNSTKKELRAGSPVSFIDGEFVDDAVPVAAYDSSKQMWGVLYDTLEENGIGTVIVSGPAVIGISGTSGKYAKPTSSGFELSDTEGVAILSSNGTSSFVLLGTSPPVEAVGGEVYNGYFKVTPVGSEKKVHISGGATDCGFAEAGELDLSEHGPYTDIYLIVEFTPYDDDDLASGGEYTLFYSPGGDAGVTLDYGAWLLATAEVRDNGVTVTQQWHGGQIYFGSIYWLP